MSIKRFFPTVRPSLDLNFAQTERLDPRITYSRSSSGTYVDSTGIIRSAATNQARFDHDPLTDESLGLLLEESRTNHILNSSTGISLSFVNSSRTLNAGIAPDGTNTAFRMTGNGGPGNAYCTFNTSLSAPRVLSYFVKQETATQARTTNDASNFVFATESFTGDPSNKIAIKYPNGWYRLIHWDYPNSNINIGLGYATADSLLMWGVQFEQGSYPTSYIPTTSSTVTRAADVAQITGANFSSWYNQSEGTVFAEAKMDFTLSVSGQFPNIYTSGAFPNRLWSLYLVNGVNALTVGSDAYSQSLQTFSSSPQTFKVAQALSNTDLTYSASKDGAAPLTGSLSKSITNTTVLSIGGNIGAVKRISRLAYYPVRLPDATLQALTS